jgi:hypothetical protein
VARKGSTHLQQALGDLQRSSDFDTAQTTSQRRDSNDDLPDPSNLPGTAARDALLSQLVSWDPSAPDAPTPASVLQQFREVDRPLAPLAAQMDNDSVLAADSSLLWVCSSLSVRVLHLKLGRRAGA